MGDLSGGQALRGVVRRIFGLADDRGVDFYTFPALREPSEVKQEIRASLDALPVTDGGDAMVAEAIASFAAHEQLFVQLAVPV
jgi:heme oxygenase